MTNQEAVTKAQKELDVATYFAETSIHAGLQTVHRNRAEWLCRVLQLAKKAMHIEENLKQPKTNADRIRAMSDEELAEFICGVFDDDDDDIGGKFINGYFIPCYDQHSIKEWLQQPADEVK